MVLLASSCFAQESDKTTKLNNFVQMLERYRKDSFEEYCNVMNNIDDNTLRRETKIIYDAIEIAPNEVKKILEDDNLRAKKVYDERSKNKLPLITIVKYYPIYFELMRRIDEKYGYLVTATVESPIIVRAKVLSLKITNDYFNSDPQRKLNRKILKLSVEEILKGVVDFAKQKEMEVFYRDWNENSAPDFNVGSSYLFYLKVEKADDIYPFSVHVNVDGSGSRFLISEESELKKAKRGSFPIGILWKQRKQDVLDAINSVLTIPEIKNER